MSDFPHAIGHPPDHGYSCSNCRGHLNGVGDLDADVRACKCSLWQGIDWAASIRHGHPSPKPPDPVDMEESFADRLKALDELVRG